MLVCLLEIEQVVDIIIWKEWISHLEVNFADQIIHRAPEQSPPHIIVGYHLGGVPRYIDGPVHADGLVTKDVHLLRGTGPRPGLVNTHSRTLVGLRRVVLGYIITCVT